MRAKTAARTACAVILAGVILVPVGGAAAAVAPQPTSQKIFADLADNGRLDGNYTKRQIDRALHSPSLRGYERPAPVQGPVGVQSAPPAATTTADRSLPFSGLDFALFAAVGGPLLLLGASLGRVARLRVNRA